MSRKTKEEVVEEFRCASIQDAAMRVIARKGLDETTIQDIADEAGIAKATVYVYFRDREEVFARTADGAFERLVANLEPAFDAPGRFADRLLELAKRQLRFFDENRALFRATMALAQRDGDAHKKRSPAFGRYMQRLETMFAQAHESGELRADIDAHAVAAIYRDCMRGVILRRLEIPPNKQRISPEEEATFVVSILLRGVGKSAGEKR